MMPPPVLSHQQQQQMPNYAAALKQNIAQQNYSINKPNINAYGSVIHQPPPPTQNPQRIPIIAHQQQKYSTSVQPAVLMAAATRTSQSFSDERASSSASTIEAKPQLRNKMAEITRFVPTSLVVRRDTKSKQVSHERAG